MGYLHEIVKNECNMIDIIYKTPRCYWEFGNTLSTIYKIYNTHGIKKVQKDEIDIFTSNYSKNYFPELTHISIKEYGKYFSELYSIILSVVYNAPYSSIKILDFGSGIIHVGTMLVNNANITRYVGYDINMHFYELNDVLLEFFSINNEILEVDTHTTFNNILMNDFNIFFFFNVLRHLDSADLSKWGSWIDNCVNSSVIIHDYNSTLNKLQVHLNCHRIKYSRFKDYIIIKK